MIQNSSKIKGPSFEFHRVKGLKNVWLKKKKVIWFEAYGFFTFNFMLKKITPGGDLCKKTDENHDYTLSVPF